MLTLITAMAAAAAAQSAQSAPAAQPMQMSQMHGMDTDKMDYSKMDHMAMGQHGDGCCKHTADGKMECSMPNSAADTHQGHSGH